MSKNCSNCGADLESNDYVDDEDKSICQSCGFVVSQAGFTDAVTQPATTGGSSTSRRQNGSLKFHYGNDREYQATGHALGRKSINVLGGMMRCPASIIEESLKLYDSVYMHEKFHCRRQKVKHTLAAVCVYITCRKYNWIITMMSLCKIAGCRPSLFNKWKGWIVKVFDIDISSIDLLDLAKKRCIEVGFDAETVKKTVQILELCRNLYISDSRIPEHLISAASYVAWLSDDPIGRKRVNFKAFCKDQKFSFTRHSKNTVLIISGVMCRLAGELPWVLKEQVRTSNVSMHIDDIIKYQTTLLSDSRAKYIASLAQTEQEESLTTDEEDCVVESGEEIVNKSLHKECNESVEQNLSKPMTVNDDNEYIDLSVILKDHSRETLRDNSINKVGCLEPVKTIEPKLRKTTNHLKNLNRADSLLFTVKRQPTDTIQQEPSNLPSHNIDDEELCNEDISENELHLYIKSASELYDSFL